MLKEAYHQSRLCPVVIASLALSLLVRFSIKLSRKLYNNMKTHTFNTSNQRTIQGCCTAPKDPKKGMMY
ncbi:hypothetical protein M23134_02761 [Microscilla marina ATCC 23134]|uniref:Uncharacterized protein n=1 Tax=Microscilla marina ATCC 23134 TaxID=313606 RepID=A1ZWF1_MICM2|nr:hypothetical protein M23134_02761 [Microscilla marina ATCC 23134]